jgi:diaminopimelate decarboxylase
MEYRTILNGNGKLPWELEEAARQAVLINVDSEFDLENIIAAARSTETPVKVLLRINPDVDPKVLPFTASELYTAIQKSGVAQRADMCCCQHSSEDSKHGDGFLLA